MKRIFIFALAAHGKGISGGDRIFIEFARRWQKRTKVVIYLNEEGREMCRRQILKESKSLNFEVWETGWLKKFGFIATYIARIINSVREAYRMQIVDKESAVIYSASEFWMDSLPTFILKRRFPKIKWLAAWYQTAPNPFRGYSEGERAHKYNLRAFLYWLAQFPVKPLIEKYADYVLVNNETERNQFPRLNRKKRAIVVLGAVDLDAINAWRGSHGKFEKIYDAVFQGRFHPQKGVVELIDIWRKVVVEKPDAKLVMIGDGPLMSEVKNRIKKYGLDKNVLLLGYVFDGDLKYKTFSQSKVVVHPAFYDSGGMASAEAMAFGLPAVGFNLKAYESYYPKGMLKAKTGDLNLFSSLVIRLLENSGERDKIAGEAIQVISSSWSWDDRADNIIKHVF